MLPLDASLPRRWSIPLLALAALLAGLAVAPTGAAAEVQEGHFRVIQTDYVDQTFSTSSFHPTNGTVLVGGGNGSYQAEYQDRVLVTSDGRDWNVVLRQRTEDGKIMDVEWAPTGDLALVLSEGSPDHGSVVVCRAPCTQASDHMTEIWRPTPTKYTQGGNHYAEAGFPGRRVLWHPSGDAALITGGGLLQWNRTHMNLVDAGGDKIYNAGDWHPSGDWSLLQRDLNEFAVCQDPCRDGTQLQPISDTHDLRFCKWHCGTPTASKSIESITFGPDGERAYVTGGNYCANCTGGKGGRGVVLEISGIDPSGGSPDPANWTTRYLVPQANGGASFGEVTDLAWHPQDREMLLTKSLEHQVTRLTEEDGQVTPPFESLAHLTHGGKMFEVDWSPAGDYAVIPWGSGFIRYDHGGHPYVQVTDPDRDEVESRQAVTVSGNVTPKPDGDRVEQVEVRHGERVWVRGQWTVDWFDDWTPIPEEDLTRRDDGVVTWNVTWNASTHGPGDYTVAVRASDEDIVGPSASQRIEVPPRAGENGLFPPSDFHVAGINQTLRTYTITWDPVENASAYFLEMAQNRSFEDGEILAELNGSTTEYQGRQEPDQRWYRVHAFVDGQDTPWTNPLLVDMTDDELADSGPRDGGGSDGDDRDGTSSFPGSEGAGGRSTDGSDNGSTDGSGEDHDKIGEGEAGDGTDDSDGGWIPGGGDGTGSASDASSALDGIPGPSLPAALAVLLSAAGLRRRRR